VRTCQHCGASLEGRRRQAIYCGGPCRAAASRARAAERRQLAAEVAEPSSARESAQKRTRPAPAASEWLVAKPDEEALAERLRLTYPELWEAA
jgi:hypothetical protein